MATGAQGNQVQIVIRALLTTQLLVVDLQVFPGTADLTSPAVSLHDPLTQSVVQLGVQTKARLFGPDWLMKPPRSLGAEKTAAVRQEGT